MKLGMDITLMTRFDPEEFLAAVERHRVQQVQMVPTMFTRLLRLPPEVRNRYECPRCARSCTPRALPATHQTANDRLARPDRQRVLRRIRDRAGGMADNPRMVEPSGTVGAPADGAQIRIVDPDHDEEVPIGEVGVVYIKPAAYCRVSPTTATTRSAARWNSRAS